jgi:hypothetical protein
MYDEFGNRCKVVNGNGFGAMMMIIILVIIFMQGMYNYKPETNHVYSVHSVAAVLYLQFVLHVMLFRP